MISIIILSYNTKNLLKECLNSIYKYFPTFTFEIIVVDNASTDGSYEMLKKDFKDIKLIKSEINLGFAKGINLGCRNAKGEYFLFLNSDITIYNSLSLEIIKFMQKNEYVSIAGGQLLDGNGNPQRSYGKFYTLPVVFKMLIHGDKGEISTKNSIIKKVDWVSGGFMAVKREVFLKLKGFDENFFMYMEDVELCYRASIAGFDTYFFPESKLTHLNQGSSNRTFAIKYIYKGLLYFYKKHKSIAEYFVLKILLWSKALSLIFIGTLTHNVYLKKTYSEAIRI